jgi:hypothetical protein
MTRNPHNSKPTLKGDIMSNAQYNILKNLKTFEDTSRRFLHHRAYDGRVVPGLVRRGWAWIMPGGRLAITRTGRLVLDNETARRIPRISITDRVARLMDLPVLMAR